MLGVAQTTRPSRCTTSAVLVATSPGTEPAAGKLATAAASRVVVTEVEARRTVRVVVAVVEAVAVLPVADEVASEVLAEAVVEGDHSGVVKVRLRHQLEASHRSSPTAPLHPY
jgi:hypothetical protein